MQYETNGSNYHDHLCRCPGCEGGDSPEEQVAQAKHDAERYHAILASMQSTIASTQTSVLDVLSRDAEYLKPSGVIGALAGMLGVLSAYIPELEKPLEMLADAVSATYGDLPINSQYCWQREGEHMGGWTCQHPDCRGKGEQCQNV